MMSIRMVLVTALAVVTFVFAQPSPQTSEQHDVNSRQEFKDLLEALPEDSLHTALHLHPQFRDGVYEKYKSAVEAVHQDNPPLATRLLAIAALDLIKRQNNSVSATPNTPTTSIPPTSANKPPPASSTPTQVVVPITMATTNSAGKTVEVTTSAVASASVSVVVPVTTTNSKGQQVVTSSTVAGAVVVSNGHTTTAPVPIFTPPTQPTGSQGIDITTTDPLGNTIVLSDVHSGQAVTTTDAQGSTFVTTYTPDGGEVSSLVLSTSTLPDGSRSTITSFAVVTPGSATHPAGASDTSNPHLQSGGLQSAVVNKLVVLLSAVMAGVAVFV